MRGHRHLVLADRRDRALQRLRRVRIAVTAFAVGVGALFVQAAASAFPGHASTRGTRPAGAAAVAQRSVPAPMHRRVHWRVIDRRHRVVRPAPKPPTSATAPTTTAAPAPTTTSAPAPTTTAAPAPAPTTAAAPAPVVSGGS